MKILDRLIRFYWRFKNQYKIHHHWASLWFIIRMAWAQSKKKHEYKFKTYPEIKL